MAQSNTFGFFQDTVRGRQKVKRNVRRYLRLLPAHKRLDKYEKMFKKRALYRKPEDK